MALLRLDRHIRPSRRFRLDCSTRPFVLTPLNGSRHGAARSIEIPEPLSGAFLSQVRPLTRGGVFEIVVPAAAVLERRLDPLPKESAPYVESVVRHQIETILPWNANDVLHATLVEDHGEGKIDVRVRATSRSAVAPALLVATECEAGEVVLVGSAAGGDQHDAAAIPVSLGKDTQTKVERARFLARCAIAALLVAALCAIGWTSFMRWSAASDLSVLERTIADRRAVLMQASASADAAGRSAIEARKVNGPLTVLVLDSLSQLLPDDTYLTDLSIDGERVRISGVSGQAAEIVPLLEKSGYFRNASFYAPTTRIPGKPADRFSIEALVAPRSQAKR